MSNMYFTAPVQQPVSVGQQQCPPGYYWCSVDQVCKPMQQNPSNRMFDNGMSRGFAPGVGPQQAMMQLRAQPMTRMNPPAPPTKQCPPGYIDVGGGDCRDASGNPPPSPGWPTRPTVLTQPSVRPQAAPTPQPRPGLGGTRPAMPSGQQLAQAGSAGITDACRKLANEWCAEQPGNGCSKLAYDFFVKACIHKAWTGGESRAPAMPSYGQVAARPMTAGGAQSEQGKLICFPDGQGGQVCVRRDQSLSQPGGARPAPAADGLDWSNAETYCKETAALLGVDLTSKSGIDWYRRCIYSTFGQPIGTQPGASTVPCPAGTVRDPRTGQCVRGGKGQMVTQAYPASMAPVPGCQHCIAEYEVGSEAYKRCMQACKAKPVSKPRRRTRRARKSLLQQLLAL